MLLLAAIAASAAVRLHGGLPLAVPASASFHVPAAAPRAAIYAQAQPAADPLPPPSAPAEDAADAADAAELVDELFELLGEDLPLRGSEASEDAAEDMAEIIEELEEGFDLEGGDGGADGWEDSPLLEGAWRLVYTSSRTFHANGGLAGYSRDLKGVTTPELRMNIQTQFRLLNFVEPISYEGGSVAKMLGGLAGAEELRCECSWSAAGGGTVFAIEADMLIAGGRDWEPADRQASLSHPILPTCHTPFSLYISRLFFSMSQPGQSDPYAMRL